MENLPIMKAMKTPESPTSAADDLAGLTAALAAARDRQTALRTERQHSDSCLNPGRYGDGRALSPTSREVLDARRRRPALETELADADLAVAEATLAYEVALDRSQQVAGSAAREEARMLLAEALDLAERLEAVNTQLDDLFHASAGHGRYRLPALRVPLNLENWRRALGRDGERLLP
jgi:hypothetical protein